MNQQNNMTNQKTEVFTKEDFFKALDKAILTVMKPKSPDEGKKRTSGENLSDDYTEKRTHLNKTEGI